MTRKAATLAIAAVAACVAAPLASAHARPVAAAPRDGAVLARAPREVRITFDDDVRAAGGIEAIRNGDGSVLGGEPSVTSGHRELVIPLRQPLPNADYTVRWRVRSDDGHTLSGVLAFAVGSGRGPPSPALSAGSEDPGATDVLARWLLFAGIALAFGGIVFELTVWRRAAGNAEPSSLASALVVGGFVLALLGLGQIHGAIETRFDRANAVGAVAAIVGAAVAAIGWIDRRVRALALLPALVLLVVPSFRGHALDAGHSRAFAFGSDLVHIGAAAIWIGGLAQLLVVVPRSPPEVRWRATKLFSRIAFGAVLVVAVTGAWRALSELSTLGQLWSTGYGRALLVKTALLAGLFGLGWLNRERLLPRSSSDEGFRRLRRSVGAELVLLAGVLVAVAFLTDLRPGRLAGPAKAARPPEALSLPPSSPGTVVLAQEQGDLAVALAVAPDGPGVRLTANVLGQDQDGVDGLRVRFALPGRTIGATACGGGCYAARSTTRPRTIGVVVGDATSRFTLPARWPAPPAARLVARIEGVYRQLRTVVLHERLASSPRHAISTTFKYVAPDRMWYEIVGSAAAIAIGRTRWDRESPNAPWVRSEQDPDRVPEPFWGSASDASLLGAGRVDGRPTWRISFLDRRVPAWFELEADRQTLRPLRLKMTAGAHFMRHRYGPFNRPLKIVPPAR